MTAQEITHRLTSRLEFGRVLQGLRRDWGWAIACSLALGLIVARAPAAVLVVCVVTIALAVGLSFSLRRLLQMGIVALPWLVVFESVLPPYLRTATAAVLAVACLVISQSGGLGRGAGAARVGATLFVAALVLSVMRLPGEAGLDQAAKYLVFPAMTLALVAGRDRLVFQEVRQPMVLSATAAILATLLLSRFLGGTESYYGANELIGYGNPHELALMALGVFLSALVYWRRNRMLIITIGVAGIAIVAFGARAGLVAAIVGACALVARRGNRLATIVAVAVAVGGVFVTGVSGVVSERVATSQETGEFLSLSSAGSGRGAIWSAAINGYASAPPYEWLIGTGLRTIPKFEEAALGGTAFVGHSDVVEVMVQLGPIGLIGLLSLWFALWRALPDSRPILVGLAAFALLSGILEYTAALVIALTCLVGPATSDRAGPQRETS